MLGHAAALYDDLTVAENVRFAVRAAGASVSKVDAVLERLELGGRVRRTPVGRLSAGQRRRVALALLVTRRPELWLLDEPHAGLDADARAVLGQVVSEVVADGATVLLASHEPEESVPLADRVVSLVGGRVVGVRAVGAMARRPLPTPCGRCRGASMWRDTVLVAGKDLRIELRSRVVMHQVVPVAVMVLVLFAFALGPDRAPMAQAAPVCSGWPCSSPACSPSSGALPSKHPTAPGTACALGARSGRCVPGQVGGGGSADRRARGRPHGRRRGALRLTHSFLPSIVVAGLAGTAGLAAAGTLYGALAAGLRVRETLLPFLFLPVAAPVLLAGTRAWQAALGIDSGGTGDPWVRLLLVFAAVYLALGVVIFGPLQEAS